MGLIDSFRKRSARKQASGPLGAQGSFYYLMSYEDEYGVVLSNVADRNAALAELFLFRFWLTQCVFRLCKPDAITEDEILSGVVPNGATLGKGMFERLNSVDIEESLDDEFSELLEDRFQTYDEAFIAGKTTADPFALESVSSTLAELIFDEPSELEVSYLTEKSKEQLADMVSVWAGNPVKARKSAPPSARTAPSKPTKQTTWALIHEFGESKVYLDQSSVRATGSLATASVMYDLKPSGNDRRNNKPVKRMLMIEEYDLQRAKFRAHRLVFFYEDGTRSDPLEMGADWKDATDGNAKTLAALRRLAPTQGGT